MVTNKQETLEEVCNKVNFINPRERVAYYNGLKNGAKWQAERMYTLDQISKDFLGEDGKGGYFDDYLDYRITTGNKIPFKEWFEQFKN